MIGRDLDPVARPAQEAVGFEPDRPWADVPPAVLERLVHYLPAPEPLVEVDPPREGDRYGQPFPLLPVQRSLWPAGRRSADDHVHIIPRAYRLRGSLDSDALARSLTVLIRRHEALRTTFALFDGSPAQMVAARGVASYRRIDLAQLPPADREFA